MENIGKKLLKLRNEKGLSLRELGKAVNLKLPKDLQEFVVKEENVPYLIVAKQLEAYDLSKLTETEMKFLIDWLKMAIEKQ